MYHLIAYEFLYLPNDKPCLHPNSHNVTNYASCITLKACLVMAKFLKLYGSICMNLKWKNLNFFIIYGLITKGK